MGFNFKNWAKRRAKDTANKAKETANRAKREVEKKGKQAVDQLERKGKSAKGFIEEGIPNIDPEEIAKMVAKQIESNVIKQVKDGVTKDIPNIVKNEIPDLTSEVVETLKKVAKENILKEVKEFGENRALPMTKVAIDEAIELNKLNPANGISFGASVAGNGISFEWDGKEQVESILTEIKDAIKDGKIDVSEFGKLLKKSLPTSITTSQGGSITIALIFGVTVDVSFSQTYDKDGIIKLLESFPNSCVKLFHDIPMKIIEAGLRGKE